MEEIEIILFDSDRSPGNVNANADIFVCVCIFKVSLKGAERPPSEKYPDNFVP